MSDADQAVDQAALSAAGIVLVTAREVSEAFGIPLGTVRSWHERGLLHSVGRTSDRGGPHRYRLLDVLRVERETRRRDRARQRAGAVEVRHR